MTNNLTKRAITKKFRSAGWNPHGYWLQPKKIGKMPIRLSNSGATKLHFLALRNIEKDWKLPQRTWKQAANQFAIMFGERFTSAIH